ncbi:MAG: hypothetical protein IKB32_00535 [Clostridia bacterium]|nr:hypothetical protein [Clostridia bacterium]
MFEIYQRYTPNQNGTKTEMTNGGHNYQNGGGNLRGGTETRQNNSGTKGDTSRTVMQGRPHQEQGRGGVHQNNIKMLPSAKHFDEQKNHNHSQQKVEEKKNCYSGNRKKNGRGMNFFENILPRGLYDPKTKKVMGFFTAEDLLLVALIFIFLDSDEEGNPLMALALLYVLLGDYFDFGDFLI